MKIRAVTKTLRYWMVPLAIMTGIWFNFPEAQSSQDPLPAFPELVKHVSPGVVNILAVKTIKDDQPELGQQDMADLFRDFLNRYFGDRMPQGNRRSALGTGFIIGGDGLILTNNHVVEDAVQLKVRLADDIEYKADIVGRDPLTDLALIKINPTQPLKALRLGDSDALQVGEWVVAIGNPFGLGNTVTSGIVSAKYRQIGTGAYDNFIQTDAAINPGNSGGPLLNMAGEVVGINSAIFSQSGGSVGIGFAIPINLAKELLPQLRQGLVKHAYIGVLSQDVTPDLQQLLDLQTDTGALVSDVDPEGPAAKAGIQRGDVILSFDGKPIKNSRTLPLIVAFTEIGKMAEVQVMRRDKTIRLQISLAEMVEAEPTTESQSTDMVLGMALQTLTPKTAQKLGLNRSEGILILEVQEGSPAAEAGFQQGDVIIEINRQAVDGMDALIAIASQLSANAKLLFLVDRGGYTVYVPLGLS